MLGLIFAPEAKPVSLELIQGLLACITQTLNFLSCMFFLSILRGVFCCVFVYACRGWYVVNEPSQVTPDQDGGISFFLGGISRRENRVTSNVIGCIN